MVDEEIAALNVGDWVAFAPKGLDIPFEIGRIEKIDREHRLLLHVRPNTLESTAPVLLVRDHLRHRITDPEQLLPYLSLKPQNTSSRIRALEDLT